MPKKPDPRSQYLRAVAAEDRLEAATEQFTDRELMIAGYHAVKAWLKDPLIAGMPTDVAAEQAADIAGKALHLLLTRRAAVPTDDELERGAFALNAIAMSANPFDLANYAKYPRGETS